MGASFFIGSCQPTWGQTQPLGRLAACLKTITTPKVFDSLPGEKQGSWGIWQPWHRCIYQEKDMPCRVLYFFFMKIVELH